MPALPYTDAIVQLDEGVRVPTNIVECAPEYIRVDMPIVAVFDGVYDPVASGRAPALTRDGRGSSARDPM